MVEHFEVLTCCHRFPNLSTTSPSRTTAQIRKTLLAFPSKDPTCTQRYWPEVTTGYINLQRHLPSSKSHQHHTPVGEGYGISRSQHIELFEAVEDRSPRRYDQSLQSLPHRAWWQIHLVGPARGQSRVRKRAFLW